MHFNIFASSIFVNWVDVTKSIQPLATIIIAFVAISNLVTIREFQKQNYRPIVSAFIRIKTTTNKHNQIELVVKNSGNRPATEVQLVVNEKQLIKCVHEHIKDENSHLKEILYILSGKSLNPIIVNGEEDVVDFHYSTDSWAKNEESIWKRNSSFLVKISYRDLNRGKYHSSQTVTID